MRILFATPYVPSRIRVRPYEFIRTLAAHHHVEAVCLTTPSERADIATLRRLCARVHPVPHPQLQALLHTVRGGVAGQPLQVAYAASMALADAVAHLAPRFDVVHLEHLRATGVPLRTGDVPVVWDAVDSISLLLDEMGNVQQPFPLRVLRQAELPRTRRHEARQVAAYRHVVVTATRDALALRSLAPTCPTEITVIPNGVDTTYFRPSGTPPDPFGVIFTGKMSYHANRAAVLAFAQDAWPAIRAALPHATFTVVGSAPPRAVRALHGRMGITVTGHVPDIRPFLARASVAVAPLVYGVGNPNKVFEAMAMGTPVVATPAAVTALDQPDEAGIVVTPAHALAGAVVRLLTTPALREEHGARGRAYVVAHRSWPEATARLGAVYRAACGDGARSVPVATK